MTEPQTRYSAEGDSGFPFEWGRRTYVAGIVNVTPDSFSDGGEFLDVSVAMQHARELIAQGADMIDVGGESTRPGAARVSEAEELARVTPVLEQLSATTDLPISIDTVKARVAEAAVKLGAAVVNDVSGLSADHEIADVAAEYNTGLIIVHNRPLDLGLPLVPQLMTFWEPAINRALTAGVAQRSIVLDPGFGFKKGVRTNVGLIRELGELRRATPFALMLGHSRKRTIAAIFGDARNERDLGTAALSGTAAQCGIDLVRVHDVYSTVTVARAFDRVFRPWNPVVRGVRAADSIFIHGIRCFAHHGVLDDECRRGQPFLVDVELKLSLRDAGVGDNLEATVDYAAVHQRVTEWVSEGPHRLIERVAERIADGLLREHAGRVVSVRVTVHKPEAPIQGPFSDVSVTVERGLSMFSV